VTFRYLFFDIDDTLLNHRQAERAALQDARQTLVPLQKVPLQRLWDTYGRINRDLWEQYGHGEITRQDLQHLRFHLTLTELGISTTVQEAMSAAYMSRYRKLWSWMPGAKDFLDWAQGHWPIGFLTNGFADVQHAKAESFGLRAYSQLYVISEEVGCMKPSACIFQYATDQAGVRPDDILYVGDSYRSDIVGAKSFGWKTAWFTSDGADTDGVADVKVGSFEELKRRLSE
jgi:5'-nucleotidase